MLICWRSWQALTTAHGWLRGPRPSLSSKSPDRPGLRYWSGLNSWTGKPMSRRSVFTLTNTSGRSIGRLQLWPPAADCARRLLEDILLGNSELRRFRRASIDGFQNDLVAFADGLSRNDVRTVFLFRRMVGQVS